MKIKPLQDRILVERVEEEETVGGIIIPDTAKEKPQKGKVIEVGPGRKDDSGKQITLGLKSGDTVLFNKYAGTEIKVEGKEYLLMREDDVMALVE
ncbi:co-chaperone GroES [candidate division WOR-3 bacterium]|uniref:Co-chaperonin GroES n=1 Tax=candidate division WOR-3 bacterium TaxID=2052148 RepID=A0A9D5QDZ2_UNCW3|nr:co-chaperone GroES [candidate division WOR-3 bacterium]MBD3365562.1 co-chaperone GroES [candidate division WOR-3 bacterium]